MIKFRRALAVITEHRREDDVRANFLKPRHGDRVGVHTEGVVVKAIRNFRAAAQRFHELREGQHHDFMLAFVGTVFVLDGWKRIAFEADELVGIVEIAVGGAVGEVGGEDGLGREQLRDADQNIPRLLVAPDARRDGI